MENDKELEQLLQKARETKVRLKKKNDRLTAIILMINSPALIEAYADYLSVLTERYEILNKELEFLFKKINSKYIIQKEE